MLEGKEIDKTFDGGAGKLSVDADDKGGVLVEMSYEKDLDGFAKVKTTNTLESNIFTIAEKITAKTGTKFDDNVVAGLKKLLGIQ